MYSRVPPEERRAVVIVASIYLGCIVALAVLLPFAPLRSNESTAEWDVFRYPKIAVSSLRVGAVVFALVGVCIYHTFQHPVVWPWRRGGRLDLIDRDGKKLCRIDSGLRDFEGIVSLVKLYCPDSVTIREKDTRGHWTELTR